MTATEILAVQTAATVVLAVATGVLAAATIGLWCATKRSEETGGRAADAGSAQASELRSTASALGALRSSMNAAVAYWEAERKRELRNARRQVLWELDGNMQFSFEAWRRFRDLHLFEDRDMAELQLVCDELLPDFDGKTKDEVWDEPIPQVTEGTDRKIDRLNLFFGERLRELHDAYDIRGTRRKRT